MSEKNILEAYVEEIDLDPIEAANLLTEHSIISDNAVTLHDVCDTDCVRAVKFLDGILFL